jgi:hypothetical protein
MDGNRELEQLDAEARALKATLMRYMSEALIEDQGLNKLTAELTKIVQASQRLAADSAARSEQKIQALTTTVEALRGELREMRTLVNDQAGKRKKVLDLDVVTEQLDRLQLEVRKLATGLQSREARGAGAPVAVDVDPPPRRPQPRARASRVSGRLPLLRFAAPLAALLLISIGYNVWQATRSSEPHAEATEPPPRASTQPEPTAPPVQAPAALSAGVQPAIANVAAVALPDVKQAAWDKIWKAALELPLQQCWPDAKSNAKVSKFRDCACPTLDKGRADKEVACEVTSKWSAEASVAALQAVLSVAAAKPITIDAKVGTGTFNAIDLVIKDCGFKEPVLTRSIEELRATRGKAPGEGKEPAAQQILGFLQKNLHSCR